MSLVWEEYLRLDCLDATLTQILYLAANFFNLGIKSAIASRYRIPQILPRKQIFAIHELSFTHG
ncbi:MAG: hypothetical protein VKL59_10335 [Nostocaceae cyanobacterium]|nr:hypothetical protein [Nostocaceae cyanobacterium]